MTNWLDLTFAAVLLAGLYATMAYGLGLIYGVLRIVNLSHAGVIMAGAYFGRVRAYAPALDAEDPTALAVSLARNALRVGDAVRPEALHLAERTLDLQRRLAKIPLEAFLNGRFRFPTPETPS